MMENRFSENRDLHEHATFSVADWHNVLCVAKYNDKKISLLSGRAN
jgi:hypothetical protein